MQDPARRAGAGQGARGMRVYSPRCLGPMARPPGRRGARLRARRVAVLGRAPRGLPPVPGRCRRVARLEGEKVEDATDAAARARASAGGPRGGVCGDGRCRGRGCSLATVVSERALSRTNVCSFSTVGSGVVDGAEAPVGAGGLASCGVVPLEQRVLPLRELRVVARAAFGQRDVEAGRRRARLRASPREEISRGPERCAHAPAQCLHAPGIRQVPPQRRVALCGLLAERLPWRAVARPVGAGVRVGFASK